MRPYLHKIPQKCENKTLYRTFDLTAIRFERNTYAAGLRHFLINPVLLISSHCGKNRQYKIAMYVFLHVTFSLFKEAGYFDLRISRTIRNLSAHKVDFTCNTS